MEVGVHSYLLPSCNVEAKNFSMHKVLLEHGKSHLELFGAGTFHRFADGKM